MALIPLYSNFDSGTIDDNPLTAGATTINSAGFEFIPEVASPNVFRVTLDPDAAGAGREVAYVTAHTASATSVTVSRGQEGTTAVEHAVDTEWAHAATQTDWDNPGAGLVTAAGSLIVADGAGSTDELTVGSDGVLVSDDSSNVSWLAAASTWTPSWTNLTVGSGTVVARFARVGPLVIAYAHLVLAADSSISGSVQVGFSGQLPALTNPANNVLVSSAHFDDNSTSESYAGTLEVNTSTQLLVRRFMDNDADATNPIREIGITANQPFTWANNDILRISFMYLAA